MLNYSRFKNRLVLCSIGYTAASGNSAEEELVVSSSLGVALLAAQWVEDTKQFVQIPVHH